MIPRFIELELTKIPNTTKECA